MNPSSRETSGISLPVPMAEQAPGSANDAGTPEQRTAAPETAPRAGAAQPFAVLPAAQSTTVPAASRTAGPGDDTSTTTSADSPVLDDNDKIEKEWVGKARRIVEKTKHDPYQQSEELTAVKADYMKRRYNKIIKVEK
jgi:hypothetical protein